MPDSKPISELITAEQTSGSDLFEIAIPNAITETGYISRKVTANALALLFNNTLQFSSQLQTTAKTLIGAINELAQGGGGGGASVAMGTTDPSASSGSNGDLYIKYDGTSYEVLAMFVKISGDWREIETGGGGESQCGAFVDYTDLIATVTFTNGSASYTATTDCYAIVRGYYVDASTAILIKVDGVLERGTSRVNSVSSELTFEVTSVLLKKGQTLTVENCLSSSSDNYIKIYGLQYSSPNLQPVIYSEDEREIGVWVDGKPLYQKTINFGALPNNGTKEVSHGISDIDHIWIFAGWAENEINDYTNLLSLANTSLSGQWYFGVNKTLVQCWTGSDRRNYSTCYVVVQYTKSTDTAGSGKWTPQGVPAVHYSTDEQVVGTWIDGSTIYEKTYIFTTPAVINYNAWTTTDIPKGSIERIIHGEAISEDGSNINLIYSFSSNDFIDIQTTRNGYGTTIKYIVLQYTKSST